MKFTLLAVALLQIGTQARAAVLYETDPEIRAKTMQILAKRNVNYREQAKERLKGKGHIDKQRIETAGMLAADDTRRFAPGDFDDFIKPSIKTDKERKKRWPWSDYESDRKEMEKAMRGEMSERALKTVAACKDMEINEIVAHSWGSQLIYAAILNGEIRPPKKLIVVGVPDDDHAKWALLAARTGTAVFWGRADNDAAALDKGVKIAKEAAKDVDFKAKWDAACADKEKKICLPHGRRPQSVAIIPIGNLPARPPLFLAHDRGDYYEALRAQGYFDVTAHQMVAADEKKVAKQMEKVERDVLAAAHEEARRLVEAARAQSKIAQRDHDERLRITYSDIAIRSCSNPGIVTQAELNALSDPYDQNLAGTPPQGLDECSIMVYLNLGRGVDAERIRRISTRTTPVPAQPVPPPFNPQPVAEPKAIQSIPGIRFSSQFPFLKDLAVKSCDSPAQISLQPNQIRSAYMYSFERESDDRLAAEMSATMGNCPRQVFNKLIERIRSGNGEAVDAKWLRDTAALYIPRGGGDYVAPPPQGCIPGDNSRRNCIACGNKYCP